MQPAHLFFEFIHCNGFDDTPVLDHIVAVGERRGYTIVIVEQNFRFAAPLADRHYVIEHGRIVETVTMPELDKKMDRLHVLLGV